MTSFGYLRRKKTKAKGSFLRSNWLGSRRAGGFMYPYRLSDKQTDCGRYWFLERPKFSGGSNGDLSAEKICVHTAPALNPTPTPNPTRADPNQKRAAYVTPQVPNFHLEHYYKADVESISLV